MTPAGSSASATKLYAVSLNVPVDPLGVISKEVVSDRKNWNVFEIELAQENDSVVLLPVNAQTHYYDSSGTLQHCAFYKYVPAYVHFSDGKFSRMVPVGAVVESSSPVSETLEPALIDRVVDRATVAALEDREYKAFMILPETPPEGMRWVSKAQFDSMRDTNWGSFPNAFSHMVKQYTNEPLALRDRPRTGKSAYEDPHLMLYNAAEKTRNIVVSLVPLWGCNAALLAYAAVVFHAFAGTS